MSYTAQHSTALRLLTDKGTAVTFSYANPGTYTRSTGLFAGASTTTVTGSAIQVKSKRGFGKDSSTATDTRTLLFAPTTYGEMPDDGSTVSWGGVTYTVQSSAPLAIDADAFLARVVLV